MRQGDVHTYDTAIHVWEDPPKVTDEYEKSLRREVMGPIVRHLRSRDWRVEYDMKVHPCIRQGYRRGIGRSRLEVRTEQTGRYLKVEFFQNVSNVENPHGGEYDFHRLERMPYLLRCRARLEMRLVLELLLRIGYQRREEKGTPGVDMTADEWIAQHRRLEQWGKVGPDPDDKIPSYNRKCRDGMLFNGARVYFVGWDRRWGVGTAEHNTNNMWWVKLAGGDVKNIGAHNIRLTPPPNPRQREFTDDERRGRLERLMLSEAEHRRYVVAERMRLALDRVSA